MADSTYLPLSLAEYESLVGDAEKTRKAFMHTIRDYMPFFDQAIIQAANDGMGDKGQIITDYPEGEIHGYNEGWGSEVALGNEVRYVCQRRSSSSDVDYDQYMDQPEKSRNQWRLYRDQAFSRGFARATVRDIFYGNPETNPKSCRGILNIVNPTDPVFGSRCIDAGGTTNGKMTDIVLVGWDPASNYLFYPQYGENKGGFNSSNEGKHEVTRIVDGKTKHYYVLRTDFRFDIGVALYNPLTVVRICNVDTSKLTKTGRTGADLIDLLTDATNLLPDEYKGRCAFYANETITGALRKQINNKENVHLTVEEVAGRKVTAWDGIPIHKLGNDVISNTGNKIEF